jgi:hypothetical protein
LKIMTESLAPANASDEGKQSGFETIQENIGHLERRLAETQMQALAFQQPALGAAPCNPDNFGQFGSRT